MGGTDTSQRENASHGPFTLGGGPTSRCPWTGLIDGPVVMLKFLLETADKKYKLAQISSTRTLWLVLRIVLPAPPNVLH